MGSTLSTSSLTITISEQLTSNGQILNYVNQQVVTGVKPFDPRIMTIPVTEVPIIEFGDEVGAGAFKTANIRYVRITNKDDTNYIRVRLKRAIANQIDTLSLNVSGGNINVSGTNYLNGTYTNVPLTGGTGSGATANIVVLGSGAYGVGTITPGSAYGNGTYTGVPLTGGTGSGALATIVVAGGLVTSVVITTMGVGYVVGDVLSASNANLGGSGSGFSVPVATLGGGVATLTLVLLGEGYTNGDTLSASNTNLGGTGSGFAIVIALVESIADIFDKKVGPGAFLIIGDASFSVSETDSTFSSFVNIESISAQADTNPIDIEYFVASV